MWGVGYIPGKGGYIGKLLHHWRRLEEVSEEHIEKILLLFSEVNILEFQIDVLLPGLASPTPPHPTPAPHSPPMQTLMGSHLF